MRWASAAGAVNGKVEAGALSDLRGQFVALKAVARDIALSTGTLNLLEFDEVHRYADAYTAQRAFEEQQGRLEAVWFELTGAADAANLSDADRRADIARVRVAQAYLRSLKQLEQNAITAYDEALREPR